MTNMALFAEQQVRADLARLLLAAVEASGRARCDIARDAQIHKDALRRVLAGERSASLGEALRILAASGVAPHAHLLLFLVSSGDHAIAWLQSDLAQFFEDFSGEPKTFRGPPMYDWRSASFATHTPKVDAAVVSDAVLSLILGSLASGLCFAI